jgi:hypothetical protein
MMVAATRKGKTMNKMIRILIAILAILAITALARNNVAWAGPATEGKPAVGSQELAPLDVTKRDPGSVKPPPAELTACEDGVHSVGGVSTLEVTNLAPGYCIAAFLRNHAFAVGHIPDGAGDVLAHITFLRIFYHGKLVYELPTEDGQVQICYAVPPGKTAQIYFFDFYGPRFGQPVGQPSWQPLETTVENGVACTTAQRSGAYALIG